MTPITPRPDFGRSARRRNQLILAGSAITVVLILIVGVALLLGAGPITGPKATTLPLPTVTPTPVATRTPVPSPSFAPLPAALVLDPLSCSSDDGAEMILTIKHGGAGDHDMTYAVDTLPDAGGTVAFEMRLKQMSFSGGALDGQRPYFGRDGAKLSFALKPIPGSGSEASWYCDTLPPVASQS